MQLQKYMFALLMGSFLLACGSQAQTSNSTEPREGTYGKVVDIQKVEKDNDYDKYSKAIFAGGCFWCTEAVFERVEGVVDVISGYSGGTKKNPTYEEVGRGETNHAEAIAIYYDSTAVTFPQLVEYFFASHDPTQLNRQGPDIGEEYRSIAFYQNPEEKRIIEQQISKLDASGKYDDPIVTEVTEYQSFYRAEDYHQDYYEHHPENPYVQRVSRPKVEKFMKAYPQALKDEYKM